MDEIAEICTRNGGQPFEEEEKQHVLEECKLDGKVNKEWSLEESLFPNRTL